MISKVSGVNEKKNKYVFQTRNIQVIKDVKEQVVIKCKIFGTQHIIGISIMCGYMCVQFQK